MRYLGLDYGSRTIGVAISDPFLMTALGLETIRRPEEGAIKKSVARLGEIIEEYGVMKIVLGYPLNLDNTESERCAKTLGFKDRLARNFKRVEIILQDERLTTVTAKRDLVSAGATRRKLGEVVDTAAAVIILQCYLEKLRTVDINGR